jgi:hypothetical protein
MNDFEKFEYKCRLKGFTAEDALHETAEQAVTIGNVVDVLLAKGCRVSMTDTSIGYYLPEGTGFYTGGIPDDYTARQKLLGDILISIDTGES